MKQHVSNKQDSIGPTAETGDTAKDALDKILDVFQNIVRAPEASWSTVLNLQANAGKYMRMVDMVRSSDVLEKRTVSATTPHQKVAEHFVFLHSQSPDVGKRDGPLKKFVQTTKDIILARGVLDPSLECSSLLPFECRNDQSSISTLGAHWLEQANFIFAAPYLEHWMNDQTELDYFKNLVQRISTPNTNGWDRIRTLTIPGFCRKWGVKARDYVGLLMDCIDLKKLVLGIEFYYLALSVPAHNETDKYRFPDVETWYRGTKLDSFFLRHHLPLQELTLVKGNNPSWINVTAPDAGHWLSSFAKLIKSDLVAAGHLGVRVMVDHQENWDEASSHRFDSEIEEIEAE